MGTSGDKIVLLDGMGSGSGSAANGLLSMIPGMFANSPMTRIISGI